MSPSDSNGILERKDTEHLAHEILDQAKEELEEAYSSETTDDEAIETLEDGREIVQYLHGDRERPDIEVYADRYDVELGYDIDSTSDYRIDPGSGELDEFYDAVRERFEPGDLDYVVGVYSGGIPPLYTASDHLEAEEIVMRYSHFSRNDTDVKTTDTMKDRADFEDADVLIVDDVISSGRTVGKVGEQILEEGADNVYAIASRMSQDFGTDHDVLEVREDRPGLLERLTGVSVTVTSSPVGTSIDIDLGGGETAGDVRLRQSPEFTV